MCYIGETAKLEQIGNLIGYLNSKEFNTTLLKNDLKASTYNIDDKNINDIIHLLNSFKKDLLIRNFEFKAKNNRILLNIKCNIDYKKIKKEKLNL